MVIRNHLHVFQESWKLSFFPLLSLGFEDQQKIQSAKTYKWCLKIDHESGSKRQQSTIESITIGGGGGKANENCNWIGDRN